MVTKEICLRIVWLVKGENSFTGRYLSTFASNDTKLFLTDTDGEKLELLWADITAVSVAVVEVKDVGLSSIINFI